MSMHAPKSGAGDAAWSCAGYSRDVHANSQSLLSDFTRKYGPCLEWQGFCDDAYEML